MKLLIDMEFQKWFSRWEKVFDWDKGNYNKNLKHGIHAEEIEKIFAYPVYILGQIIGHYSEPRWLLLGEIIHKRWALTVTTRGNKLRIISCRRQRKSEEQFYDKKKNEKK